MEGAPEGVLVFIDGSDTGRRALDVAMGRARDRGTSLTVLAVVPPRLWRAKRSAFQIPQDRRDEDFVERLLEDARRHCHEGGIEAETRVRSGPPADIICDEALRGFDLLVIGERPSLVGAPSLASIVKDRLDMPLEIVREDGEDTG